ncbi:hypothetical protein IQ268_04130 [Oculatella sp. LEGE 06141]|uniref:hypothetical protein n=1 Tax=Oculatella sp. LEGE 06141 TaxID=1828648 RepID=UPI00188139F4|nr:hypothetical protein [Oculatella sp. LEGE 06141]MBE9177768.1 hypothetical protein [Oculatella sp. LEGE 06141]
MLHKLLHRSTSQSFRATWLWFGLSLIVPIYFGIAYLQEAFSAPYLVQDDVRQHVVWFQRWVDPELFQNDLIADYFQAIAPPGFKALYVGMARLGIEPLLLAKLLPPVIGVLAAVFAFGVTLQLFAVPAGAFVSSLILTQSLWLGSDLVSATSRAFPVVLLLAFLYFLLNREAKPFIWTSLIPCLLAIALQGLFYPILLPVEGGVLTLRLVRWEHQRLRRSPDRRDDLFWLTGLAVALGTLAIAHPNLGELGPTVTAAQMVWMPEFQADGRGAFFNVPFWQRWLVSNRGISPPFYPTTIWLSLLLPTLIKRRFPLTQHLSQEIKVLVELLIPSVVLFTLAHLLLLRLYFPSRHTQHSLRVVMALAAGIVATILLETGRRWLLRQRWHRLRWWQYGAIAAVGLFAIASVVVPGIPLVFHSGHVLVQGQVPELYEFLANQPKTIRVASLASEAENLAVFSQRSVLTAREYALPFHLGYYNRIRLRTVDLLRAHYSPDLSELQQFIQTYTIDFILLQRGAFRPDYVANNSWLMQYQPEANQAIERLNQPERPALARLINQCSVLNVNNLVLLEANCITGAQPQ